ncbi:DUF5134 domain-containing protein [Brevibacterium sp. LE-L]|nr:DUF5134 domain-containing protein [Brevibacterium sp. S111]
MFGDPVTQWCFTVVFLVLGLDSTIRMVIDRRRPLQSVGHGLHLAMSVVMMAMAWPWWSGLPSAPQVVFFTVAAGWFVLMLLAQSLRRMPRWYAHGHNPWHLVMHVVMMLTMVWMVVSMAGMGPSAPGHDHSSLSLPIAISGVVLTGGLIVAAMICLVDCMENLRGDRRSGAEARASGAQTLMNLGMAAMCLPMLVV